MNLRLVLTTKIIIVWLLKQWKEAELLHKKIFYSVWCYLNGKDNYDKQNNPSLFTSFGGKVWTLLVCSNQSRYKFKPTNAMRGNLLNTISKVSLI